MRTHVLAASILAWAGLLHAQPGGPAADPAQPAETTEVRGRVLSAQSGGPVRGAKVAITTDERETVSVFARFNGSFVIENAPVGDHEIGVAASGYELLRKRIRIPPGRPLDGLDLRINRSAIITGRVLDENDRAVVGARVEALQESFIEGRARWQDRGSRITRGQGGFRTDDRGVYRIFGLSAGEYLIAVRPKERGLYRIVTDFHTRRFLGLSIQRTLMGCVMARVSAPMRSCTVSPGTSTLNPSSISALVG